MFDRQDFYEIQNSISQISLEFQSRRKPISIQREISSSYLRVPSSYKFWNWVSVFFLCIKAKLFCLRMMYHLIRGTQKEETIETDYDLQNNIMLSAKVLVLIRPFFMMSFWLGHLYDVREVSREEIETLSHILLKLLSLIFASSLSVQRNLTSRLCQAIKIFMGEGSIFGHKVNFLVLFRHYRKVSKLV